MKSRVEYISIALATITAVIVAACATPRNSDTYYAGQALHAQSVEQGVTESLRPVTIQQPQTGVGTVGGAALGGIAGSTIGGGSRANAAGTIAGAIVGGVIGSTIERDATKANGVEITVRLDSGKMIAIAQEGAGTEFRPGDRVRVLSDGYTTRVTH
jgi:outer membrane lipoprotein SlyB